jgi:hypothetical protein
MTLRDASAYNVQFKDGKPILIDTLSFERAAANQPWKPYRQFCENFLARWRSWRTAMGASDSCSGPGSMACHSTWPRSCSAQHPLFRAGARRAHPPPRSRAAPALRRLGANPAAAKRAVTMSENRRLALLDHLKRTVEGLHLPAHGTVWADYADQTSYSATGTASKEATVKRMAEAVAAEGGKVAWDVGANTGRYSAIAADAGFWVLALDIDWAAVERHYLALKASGEKRIMPFLAGHRRAVAGIGWGNVERAS